MKKFLILLEVLIDESKQTSSDHFPDNVNEKYVGEQIQGCLEIDHAGVDWRIVWVKEKPI